MTTAAETVLEPTERVRARKKLSDAALTTLEPTERVRAQKGRYTTTRSGHVSTKSGGGGTGEAHPDGGGIHLRTHTFHLPVPIPYISLKKMPARLEDLPARLEDLPARLEQVPARLEQVPTRDLVFYGGLGALAVVGALDWPVALAVGGATWLVRSRQKDKQKEKR
ncbi:hypothetical protein [Streptomyces thermoalcalitolerans]|uniref:Uncharacterized protein n=1 Tax=Streptomyces thermoalcalitolerans TaxID=65605 RepID=A0ABN1NZI8_9ACTN